MPCKSGKQRRKKYAVGGAVDNIEALLTAGEFVLTREASESIGYDNLDYMNKTGNLPRIKDARKRRK